MRGRRRLAQFLFLTPLYSFCPVVSAFYGSNVTNLYNAKRPDGEQIADHYAELHSGAAKVPISGIDASDCLSADGYLNIIRPEVRTALAPSYPVFGNPSAIKSPNANHKTTRVVFVPL